MLEPQFMTPTELEVEIKLRQISQKRLTIQKIGA
jgi:hypothetical protein